MKSALEANDSQEDLQCSIIVWTAAHTPFLNKKSSLQVSRFLITGPV